MSQIGGERGHQRSWFRCGILDAALRESSPDPKQKLLTQDGSCENLLLWPCWFWKTSTASYKSIFSKTIFQEVPKLDIEESQVLRTLMIYPIYSKAKIPKAVKHSRMY